LGAKPLPGILGKVEETNLLRRQCGDGNFPPVGRKTIGTTCLSASLKLASLLSNKEVFGVH